MSSLPAPLDPLDLVVLVSGSGTNLQAILDAIHAGRLRARVRLVLSNRAGAPALERATRARVPVGVVSHLNYGSRAAFDAALVTRVREALGEADAGGFVVLAGFMRMLTPTFLDAFPRRVVNIHPSLLPAFPGMDAQAQAIARGVRISGCTVHLVDGGTDTGPILAQAAVPVHDGDDATSLSARILVQEHVLLPTVLQWIAEGRLEWRDGHPFLRGVVAALGI